MVSEEHPVPTAPEHPTCCVCKQPAARRCNECSSDTPLFLCEDKACFEQTHNACNGRRHEATLVAWDRRPTAAPTTCRKRLTCCSESLAVLLDSARAACVEAAAVEAQSGVLEQVFVVTHPSSPATRVKTTKSSWDLLL